jgi:hypothetical protein
VAADATIAFAAALGDVGWSPPELARRLTINGKPAPAAMKRRSRKITPPGM